MQRIGIPGQLRLVLFLTLTGVFLSGSQISVFALDTKCEIQLSEKRLSAKIENAPLGSVLEKMREKTGVEFEIAAGHSERPVSASFRDLTQEEGLKWILDGYDYLFLVGSGGKVEKVVIVGFIDKRRPVRVVNAGTNQEGSMLVSLPSRGGMKIMHGKDSMVVEPPSKEVMEIVRSPGTMVVEPPKENGM